MPNIDWRRTATATVDHAPNPTPTCHAVLNLLKAGIFREGDVVVAVNGRDMLNETLSVRRVGINIKNGRGTLMVVLRPPNTGVDEAPP